MQVIPLACRPVAPPPPLLPAPVARRPHRPVQEQPHLVAVVTADDRGQLGATGVEVEAAREAVVEEALDGLLAGVAVAGCVAWRVREEVEGAFGVERVEE